MPRLLRMFGSCEMLLFDPGRVNQQGYNALLGYLADFVGIKAVAMGHEGVGLLFHA